MVREKTRIVSARITEEQFTSLENLAKKRGVSTSTLLNDCVNKLIGGEIKPSVGTVTEEVLEEVLEEHINQLKHELLGAIKQQQLESVKTGDPHTAQTDPSEKSKTKIPAVNSQRGEGLSARGLAKRLGADRKTLARWKEKGNEYLAKRTRERDPEGKAWVFDEQTTMYVETEL
ncbi:MAG: hypothetical protein ACLFRN_07230 [Halothece sp.]